MSYAAIISRIQVRPHPNADRLQLATVAGGSQVVVGLDNYDGQLGIFYPSDGVLSHENIVANELYTKSAMDKLELAYDAGHKFGFIDANRRVRCQTFRGEKSDGLWLPIESLDWATGDASTEGAWTGGDALAEGEQYTVINGMALCGKYVSPATKVASHAEGRRQKRGELLTFPKHVDTKQFRYFGHLIPAGSIVTITEKLHGTSHRISTAEVDRDPTWRECILGYLDGAGWNAYVSEWKTLHGTRNVIIGEATEHAEADMVQGGAFGWYGSHAFRFRACGNVVPRKGEVVYGEIVGDVDMGAPVMPTSTVPSDLPDIKKTYGNTMAWRYGTRPGESEFYVYRIVQTTEDGDQVELSWSQVQRRARDLGLNVVPFIYQMRVESFEDLEQLCFDVDTYSEGASTLDASHIREGVVVRVDFPDGDTDYFKSKSFAFRRVEDIVKADESYVDTEEAA